MSIFNTSSDSYRKAIEDVIRKSNQSQNIVIYYGIKEQEKILKTFEFISNLEEDYRFEHTSYVGSYMDRKIRLVGMSNMTYISIIALKESDIRMRLLRGDRNEEN